MRDDKVILTDIVEAAARIERFISGMDRTAFLEDQKTQAAVMHEITIMGEAASQLSHGYRNAHPDVTWTDMIRLRNLYIHVYHRINYRRVWRTATLAVPAIRRQVSALLASDTPAE